LEAFLNGGLFFVSETVKVGEVPTFKLAPTKKSYVGPISFFGWRGRHAHSDEDSFIQGFDVTSMVQKLRSANKGVLPELDVSVVPHSTTRVE
jgi:hypothetical protein